MTSASLGTLGIKPVLQVAPLPSIISEWASLIPLACHLASSEYSHQLVGRVALTGRLSISLFPKLGVTNNIAQFLEQGLDYLDRVSVMGHMSHEVWDVNWGSRFPCANGAACAIISKYALSNAKAVIFVSEHLKSASEDSAKISPRSSSRSQSALAGLLSYIRTQWARIFLYVARGFHPMAQQDCDIPNGTSRRYQKLHTLDFRRVPMIFSWRLSMYRLLSSFWWEFSIVILLSVGTIILGLYGLYGTAAAVLAGTVSKVACWFLCFNRPPGFLTNNEAHDACMLVAVHRNSSTWCVYTGDRGIVDYLLNKPMITPPIPNPWLLAWFRLGHRLQLLAMTFVAAQKGWDGIAMIIMMLLAFMCEWRLGDNWIARQWLEMHGVRIEAKTFQFGSRTQMMNAIQILSGTKVTSWMDDIIVPHPRRDAVLKHLDRIIKDPFAVPSTDETSDVDGCWISLQAQLACEAAEVIRREFADITQV